MLLIPVSSVYSFHKNNPHIFHITFFFTIQIILVYIFKLKQYQMEL